MARQRPTRLVMGPCIVEIDQVNWCRNEEIIEKGNFGWAWPMWAERPRINHIVIREVQYQFEVNRSNFGWAWPMWAGRHRIYRIFIRKVQYQFEVNRCRNEEIIVKLQFWVGPQVKIDRIVIREVRYQFEDNRYRNEKNIFQGSSANSVEGDNRRTAEITTISPRFSKNVGINR
ncbi:hypothetical protein DPMN_104360 [Dreissena polymorpha]|uniref:Uncharacterized protein n=1 Tax=Dreissena polymorpha TaxID=45954 RepID=A0A9D4H9M5_DREPO|nr:hypothetical protein DPMN_104360 [Dreissena polymorpha]